MGRLEAPELPSPPLVPVFATACFACASRVAVASHGGERFGAQVSLALAIVVTGLVEAGFALAAPRW